MIGRRLGITAGLLTGAILLSACGPADGDWNKATAQNTLESYQTFLRNHPDDSHAAAAKAKIAELSDNTAFAMAKTTNTAAAYKSYLSRYPQGANVTAANEALAGLQSAEDWKTAQNGDAAALQAFLQKYPTGPESEQAQAKLKTLTGYRVQLASEPSQEHAQKALQKIKSKLGDSVAGLDIAAPGADQKSYLIQSSGMTEDAAKSTCVTVKKRGQSCQVVASAG